MDEKYRFTIVRHGQTPGNSSNRYLGITDEDLNSIGVQQARNAAQFLLQCRKSFDICFSSPLLRCVHTANILKTKMNFDYLIEPKLRERNYGVFEGLTRDEVKQKYPDLLQQYNQNKARMILPQGESALDVESRIHSFLWEDLPQKFSSARSVLLITHLNPLRAILRLLKLKTWDIYYTKFQNASITQIHTDLQVSELVLFNKTPANSP
ncbi:histidine phosphatase family protein [Candidatus Lokiarchaeum ossiferum]|uniref:histidine phosphatase family protein n=1 Tax=Candidatus Lokiarchaeum ossiferum TaxID=2951803 RepID=UPI00352F99E0